MIEHHAFIVEAKAEEGVAIAHAWIKKHLGLTVENNPDVTTHQYGLLSVEDARKLIETAMGAPFAGSYKAIIISADRVYHEAQNALLKLFEEPPKGTHLFLVLPSIGNLLPTLRSRVHILHADTEHSISEVAREFLVATREKRSALIKKLTSGKDEEDRRELREEAIAIVNGVEALLAEHGLERHQETLREIAEFRSYLYDRSAPVKLILEHLSLTVPSRLV